MDLTVYFWLVSRTQVLLSFLLMPTTMTGYLVGFKQKYEKTLFAPKDKDFQSTFFVLTFSHSCIFVSICVTYA